MANFPAICFGLKTKTIYKIKIMSEKYGSLYVTLCFVLCRFDFDVLTFYFCILLHILNGVIHEVEPRWRRNEEGRR